MTTAARRRIVAKEAPPQHDAAERGWMVMGAHDLLAFHDATKRLPNRGWTTYEAGERWSEDLGRDVNVMGVERDVEQFRVSLVTVMLIGDNDALAKLERRADKANILFELDDGIANVGPGPDTYDASDRDTDEKAIQIAIDSEDAMAYFIRGARDANLLKGVTINVPDLTQRMGNF